MKDDEKRTDTAPEWKERLKKLKLLILDVDGVLTDGRIVMNDRGEEWKFFDVKDGHGIKMLMRYHIDVVFLTGRRSAVVEHRAADLGVREIHQKVWNKLEIYEEIIRRRGLTDGEVAFMGDDIVDVPVMRRVGFAASVPDAMTAVKQTAHYVTERNGGRGAVREVCDLILEAQGWAEEIKERYQLPHRDKYED